MDLELVLCELKSPKRVLTWSHSNWVLQSVDLMPKGEDGVNAAGSLISANSGMMVVLVRPRLALRVLQLLIKIIMFPATVKSKIAISWASD